MSFKSVLKFLGIRQNSKAELVSFKIDESAIVNGTNAGMSEGSKHGVITKNGTGDYTITLNRTCRRTPIVVGVSPLTEDLTYKTIVTTNTIQVVFANLSGTDTVTDFDLTAMLFFSSVER